MSKIYTFEELANMVHQYEIDHSLDISVVVENISSEATFYYRADTIRPSASLIKLFILVALALYVREETGNWNDNILIQPSDRVLGSGIIKYMKLPLAFTVHDLATYMITYSDNIAANKIIDLLSFAMVNKVIANLDASDTCLRCKMMKATNSQINTTSAKDVARFYKLLVENPSPELNPRIIKDCCQFLFKRNNLGLKQARKLIDYVVNVAENNLFKTPFFLRAIGANQIRERIALNIPKHIQAGLRSAGDQKRFHDSGLFLTCAGPVVIVIMIENPRANFLNRRSSSYLAAQQFCASIGELFLKDLTRQCFDPFIHTQKVSSYTQTD